MSTVVGEWKCRSSRWDELVRDEGHQAICNMHPVRYCCPDSLLIIQWMERLVGLVQKERPEGDEDVPPSKQLKPAPRAQFRVPHSKKGQ